MPLAFWAITAFVFGICIGSFLNVVIWRLPRNESLVYPQHSYCPGCKAELQPVDLVPLFSFLALRAKCRRCKAPISWRYFGVELLTGLLFVALTVRYLQHPADCVAMLLFAAILIPIFFIDLATFHIQTSLNVAAFAVPLARDAWGFATHEPGHTLLWGWLPPSIAGAVVGVLIFGAIRVFGWLAFHKEAMGLGDVLLARAMGAMLALLAMPAHATLFLFPTWFFLAIISGLVIGVAQIALRARHTQAAGAPLQSGGEPPETGEETATFTGQVAEVLFCLCCLDVVEYAGDVWRRIRRRPPAHPEPEVESDDFTPDATAIPFGPFMVIGFFAAAFVGEPMTVWYLTNMMGLGKG